MEDGFKPTIPQELLATDLVRPYFTAEVLLITPELAKYVLKFCNDQNYRPEIKNNSRNMTADIQAGLWLLNGQSMSFTIHGILSDGQNRMRAIAESNVTVPSLIVRGLQPEVTETQDTGRARTVANIYRKHKVKHARVCAGIGIRIAAFRRDCMRDLSAISKVEAGSMYVLHPELVDSTAYMASIKNKEKLKKFPTPSGPFGFAHWAFSLVNPEMAEKFFAGIRDGVLLAADSPMLALRSRFVREDTSFKNDMDALAVLYKGWNAFISGKSMMRAKFQDNEDFPTFFGEQELKAKVLETTLSTVSADIRTGVIGKVSGYLDKDRVCDICGGLISVEQIPNISIITASKVNKYLVAHGAGECEAVPQTQAA
jgi:hypothetical protein